MQIIIAIRHGQSEYNAACQQHGAGKWSDPRIFDPHLTPLGCEQTVNLRAQLTHELATNRYILENPKSVLWVASPLQRCLETLLLSCPALPRFDVDASQVRARARVMPSVSLAAPFCHDIRLLRKQVTLQIMQTNSETMSIQNRFQAIIRQFDLTEHYHYTDHAVMCVQAFKRPDHVRTQLEKLRGVRMPNIKITR